MSLLKRAFHSFIFKIVNIFKPQPRHFFYFFVNQCTQRTAFTVINLHGHEIFFLFSLTTENIAWKKNNEKVVRWVKFEKWHVTVTTFLWFNGVSITFVQYNRFCFQFWDRQVVSDNHHRKDGFKYIGFIKITFVDFDFNFNFSEKN